MSVVIKLPHSISISSLSLLLPSHQSPKVSAVSQSRLDQILYVLCSLHMLASCVLVNAATFATTSWLSSLFSAPALEAATTSDRQTMLHFFTTLHSTFFHINLFLSRHLLWHTISIFASECSAPHSTKYHISKSVMLGGGTDYTRQIVLDRYATMHFINSKSGFFDELRRFWKVDLFHIV